MKLNFLKWNTLFAWLQVMGKSLMLPVSVLPAVGLLLGLGSASFSWLPESLSLLMSSGGGAVFALLPVLFAIGVALGFTQNDATAGMAAVIGHSVMNKTFIIWVTQQSGDPLDTGVFGGILVGILVAILYQRFSQVSLPPYLGFFSGKRLIPILTSVTAIFLGVTLAYVWPPIAGVIKNFSAWAAHENPVMAFALYGVVERALIPLGLHHIWNTPFFFEVGQYIDPLTGETVTGEIARFLKGDPTAGYLAGGYLFKMWGLPAAALAIAHSVKNQVQKKAILGLMLSASLTSFLTGITEPIEFSFLFVAPILYVLHALMSGLAFAVCILFEIKHGTTFSHGLIDYLVLLPKSSHAYGLWILGPIWALIYYFLFRYCIVCFDLKTPGREDEIDREPSVNLNSVSAKQDFASSADHQELNQILQALGGVSNIKQLDACITRLRVQLYDIQLLDEALLRDRGASGVFKMGQSVQVVMGTRSEELKTKLQALIQTSSEITHNDITQKKEDLWTPLSAEIKSQWSLLGDWMIYNCQSSHLTRLRLRPPTGWSQNSQHLFELQKRLQAHSWVVAQPQDQGCLHIVGSDIERFLKIN